jgi:hypothetical protein
MILDRSPQMVGPTTIVCPPLLLVRMTGGDKSAVQDTFVILLAGVTLAIMHLLYVAANKVMEKLPWRFGAVIAFHLDESKDPTMQQDLLKKLVSLPCNLTKNILLCKSLQALQNHYCWQALVW